MDYGNQLPQLQWGYSPNQAPQSPDFAYPQSPQPQYYAQFSIPQQRKEFAPSYDHNFFGQPAFNQPANTPLAFNQPANNPPAFNQQVQNLPPIFNPSPHDQKQQPNLLTDEGYEKVNTTMKYYFAAPPPLPGSEAAGAATIPESSESKARTDFSTASVRAEFVRKLYSLITIMLLVVSIMCAIPFMSRTVNGYLRENVYFFYISLATFAIITITIACFTRIRRIFPINIVATAILAISLGFVAMTICSVYSGEAVPLILIATTASCSGIIVFCMQAKCEFTKWTGKTVIAGWCLFIFGIIAVVTIIFLRIHWLCLIYAFLGMLLCMGYFVIDTQLIIKGKQHDISPEDYVEAAVSLFTDMVTVFACMIRLIGNKR